MPLLASHNSSLAKIFINPFAAVPEHALRLRADDRRHRRDGLPPLVREGVLGRLAAAGRLGCDRHRESLLDRRGTRLGGRRLGGADRLTACSPAPAPRPGPGGRGRRKRPRPRPAPGADHLASADGIFGAPEGPGSARRNGRRTRNGQELRAYARDRLIESRLTPNAISRVGLVLNLLAAALVTQRLFFLAGLAFIVGSVMDTLDGRYSRMSGKGTLFGAFLDSTLDRIEEGVVLAAVAGYFAASGQDFAAAMCVVAVLGSLMVSYTRARAEALGVECKVGVGDAPGQGGATFDRLGLCQGRRNRALRVAGAGDLRDRRSDHRHRGPARMACPKRALQGGIRRRRRRWQPAEEL